jgi:hypothetical protein
VRTGNEKKTCSDLSYFIHTGLKRSVCFHDSNGFFGCPNVLRIVILQISQKILEVCVNIFNEAELTGIIEVRKRVSDSICFQYI